MVEDEVLAAAGDNAFTVMGVVTGPLRRAEGHDAVARFMTEATSGDYDHLVEVCRKWAKALDNDTVVELV